MQLCIDVCSVWSCASIMDSGTCHGGAQRPCDLSYTLQHVFERAVCIRTGDTFAAKAAAQLTSWTAPFVPSRLTLRTAVCLYTGDTFAAKAGAYVDIVDSPNSEPDPTPDSPDPDDLHNPDDRWADSQMAFAVRMFLSWTNSEPDPTPHAPDPMTCTTPTTGASGIPFGHVQALPTCSIHLY